MHQKVHIFTEKYQKEAYCTQEYNLRKSTYYYQKVPDQKLVKTKELKKGGRNGERSVELLTHILQISVRQSVSDTLRI